MSTWDPWRVTVTSNEWRSVVGYEGLYEVSSEGQVRALRRTVTMRDGRSRTFPAREVTWKKTGQDDRAGVDLSRGGFKERRYVHTLVLEAFTGPRIDGMVACHNDGNRHNNRADNLRWDSVSANNHDTVKHGRHWKSLIENCPRGHRLAEPNLVPSSSGRDCLACSRGGAAVRRGVGTDRQVESDRYYSLIVGTGVTLRRPTAAVANDAATPETSDVTPTIAEATGTKLSPT